MKLEITKQTTLADVYGFLKAHDSPKAKVRGEYIDGKLCLRISKKGGGSGLKNRLFKTVDTRRRLARDALEKLIQSAAEPLGMEAHIGGATGLDIRVKSFVSKLDGKLAEHKSKLLLPKLPNGMKIIDNVISGESVFMEVPDIAGKDLIKFRGKPLAELLQDLAPKAVGTLKLGNTALPVTRQALGDFYRMDYAIENNGKSFKSRDMDSTNQDERNQAVGQALFEFTGGDPNAAKMLSGLMTQQVPTALLACLGNAFNAELGTSRKPDFRIMTAANTAGQAALKVFNKELNGLDPASTRGLGGAKFNLSKTPEGDYKVSISWQPSFMGGGDASVKFAAGEAMSARFDIDIIVNAEQAKNGVLAIEIPDGLRVKYSGRLAG